MTDYRQTTGISTSSIQTGVASSPELSGKIDKAPNTITGGFDIEFTVTNTNSDEGKNVDVELQLLSQQFNNETVESFTAQFIGPGESREFEITVTEFEMAFRGSANATIALLAGETFGGSMLQLATKDVSINNPTEGSNGDDGANNGDNGGQNGDDGNGEDGGDENGGNGDNGDDSQDGSQDGSSIFGRESLLIAGGIAAAGAAAIAISKGSND